MSAVVVRDVPGFEAIGIVPTTRAACALMAVSGFAGLGYQIVWTQQCALWLGHDAAAVLAVVAAFFAGLAVGAWSFGPVIERSRSPSRWYAACEAVVGAWGLVLAFAMAPTSRLLVEAIGPVATPAWHWAVAFGGTFAMLLPATAAMGATLPAVERVAAATVRPRSIAAFYASNTLGAVAGVVAAAWAVPAIGLTRAAVLCAILNFLCAGVATTWRRSATSAALPVAAVRRPGVPWALVGTGFLGIGYEVVVVRVLSQVTEDTVYTFAALLATYLAGTAIGAASYARCRARWGDGVPVALVVAVLVGSASLWVSEEVRDGALSFVGRGVASAVAIETLLAIAAFALPTIAMGALFAHLADRAHAAGCGYGRALAWNTIGAAAAPCLFGVGLAPTFGAKFALIAIVAGYLAITVAVHRATRPWFAVLAASVVLAAAAPPLVFVDVPDGGRVVSYREGALGAVSVVEDAEGVARLRIDNRQQEGSNATRFVDARQALLPLALQPSARRALFIGLGTGVTASAAAEDPLLAVDAVELVPEVIEASTFFTRPFATGDRLHTIAADARRYVRTTTRTYDLVVADNFHPARSGSGALYTVEHFTAIRARLVPRGLFCQWLPLHQLDLPTLRSIVRSFLTVFPDGAAILASNSLETPVIGLVARRGGALVDMAAIDDGLVKVSLPRPFATFGLDDAFAVAGSVVAGPSALSRFAGDAPPNTDDRPVVAYRAPRVTYAPTSTPSDRLTALLDSWSAGPDDDVLSSTNSVTRARLAAYRTARRRFIAAGRDVHPSQDVVAMLTQVREPLLSVLATSPDFRPAYDPLLRMGLALAADDPEGARSLLQELARLAPARPEAAAALRRLDG